MNKCEILNLTIQRMANLGGRGKMLPREYQQVEYIKSEADGQYIDTGVSATAIKGFETRIQLDYSGTSYKAGFGCNSNSQGNIYLATPSENRVLLYIRGASSQYMTTGEIHEISLVDNTLKIDGVNKGRVTFSAGDTTNLTLFVFGTLALAQQTYTTIYYFRVYGNEMIRNLIPCYRKLDRKTGMFDIVNSTFYPNLGSGEFTVGNNV